MLYQFFDDDIDDDDVAAKILTGYIVCWLMRRMLA